VSQEPKAQPTAVCQLLAGNWTILAFFVT